MALQNRLDEQGWEAIINAMSRIITGGSFRPGEPRLSPHWFASKRIWLRTWPRCAGRGLRPMHFESAIRGRGDSALSGCVQL